LGGGYCRRKKGGGWQKGFSAKPSEKRTSSSYCVGGEIGTERKTKSQFLGTAKTHIIKQGSPAKPVLRKGGDTFGKHHSSVKSGHKKHNRGARPFI